MENKIKLKENGIIRVDIYDKLDNYTGNYLTFDLEDVELPLRYQNMVDEHYKNFNWVKQMITAIGKKEDHKIKNSILTTNEKETFKVLNEFYHREQETLDKFLGKDGCKKLLNGRKPYLEMFNDISNYLEPLLPVFEESSKKMDERLKERIKAEYKSQEDNNNNTLEG